MRMSRLAASIVAIGLVGAVPVLATAPANAAALGSSTTLSVSPPNPGPSFEVGDSLYFEGGVKGSDGVSTPSNGNATLQVYTPANPVWTSISVDTTPSSYFFSGVTASTNALYKVVFSGGTSGYGSSTNSYSPSESAPVTVSVTRKVKLTDRRLQIQGKVTPDYAKKKVKVLRKVGSKFKKFTTIKTDRKGKFVFNAPRRNRFKFILVIPGDANYAAYPSVVYTVRVY